MVPLRCSKALKLGGGNRYPLLRKIYRELVTGKQEMADGR